MDLDTAFELAPDSRAPVRPWPWPPAEEVIPDLVEIIVREFNPVRIILFGSRARGAQGPASDVDLLVVLRTVTDKRGVAARMRDALAAVPVSKDIIVTTPQEIEDEGALVGGILYPALRDGKVLYESERAGAQDPGVVAGSRERSTSRT